MLLDSGDLGRAELSFAEYFDIWIAAVTPKLAPRTIDGYDSYIRRYAYKMIENMPIADIRSHHIQQIYLSMDVSPTTVRNLHAALRTCFSYAKRREYITANPCDNTDLPARTRREITVLDFEQTAAFIKACGLVPHGIVFEFAIETGMRPEEYLGLRWSDLSAADASVQQVVQHRPKTKGGGFYFAKPKTSKSRRRVPISDALRKRIAAHRTEQLRHRLAMKGTWFDHDLVFPNEIGRPMSLHNLTRRYLKPALDLAGLAGKGITLYSLRHTCATLLLMSGENPKVVADRLGHASVTLTLDTYSHVLPHIQADATAALSKIMRG